MRFETGCARPLAIIFLSPAGHRDDGHLSGPWLLAKVAADVVPV